MADYAISNVPRRVVYTNTGVGPYAFTFEILANTDIAVYRGTTLLTLTTDYSVTINSNGTGSVTLVTAGTGNISIVGARAIQRTSDYTTGGDLFASTLNTDLDSQTIYSQQVAELGERALKAPVTDPTDIAMTLPVKADRASKYLGFDSVGNPIALAGTTSTPGTLGNQNANAVDITGGTINGTSIGATSRSSGAFTTLAASDVATFSAGTVSAPSITTTGDTNTGIFFPAADSIAFTKGGVQAMRITASSTAEFTRAAGTVPASYDAGELISGLNTDSAYTADKRVIALGASPATATNGTSLAASSGYVRSTGNLSFVSGSTECMRIATDGNISLGPVYTAAGAQKTVQISATDNYIIVSNCDTTSSLVRQYFFNPNGVVGSISVSGSATTYATSSDYRLKENIAPMVGALDTVAQLKPCTYTWKVDGEAGQGFIAHELQAVVPDAVSGSKDGTEDIGNTVDADGNIVSNNVTKPTNLQEGWSWEKTGTKPVYQGVDTSFLVATLTAAIQELKAEVDSVKAELVTLKGAA